MKRIAIINIANRSHKMNPKLFLILFLAACLTGCGTVVNTAVAGYEQNIATNAVQSEKNQANAATFILCRTPMFVLPYLTTAQRKGIQALCVATDANTETAGMVNTTAAAVPVHAK